MKREKKKKSNKRIWIILGALLLIIVACVLVSSRNTKVEEKGNDIVETKITSQENSTTNSGESTKASSNEYANIENNPIVTLNIKDMGTIKIELYPQIAPETVENFVELVQSGFYDGLIFHRVIPGFMAQGGDKAGTGSGKSPYSIKGEFSSNGVENSLSHTRGVVSMARSSENDSAYSQFFIVTTDSTYLDGNYAAFGKVIEGMDIADKIVNQEVIRREVDSDVNYYTDPDKYVEQMLECDRPVNPPVIETATVEVFGVEYDSPNKILNEA